VQAAKLQEVLMRVLEVFTVETFQTISLLLIVAGYGALALALLWRPLSQVLLGLAAVAPVRHWRTPPAGPIDREHEPS